MRIVYEEPASRGSLAEVWSWLVHLPYLGWALLGVLALVILAVAFYIYIEIDLARRGL